MLYSFHLYLCFRFLSNSSCPNSLVGLLEANKYKMLMRIPLDDLEVMKGKGNSSSSVWINKIKETVALDSQR